jgi:hypothetical protein
VVNVIVVDVLVGVVTVVDWMPSAGSFVTDLLVPSEFVVVVTVVPSE